MNENDNNHAGDRELLLNKFSKLGIDGLTEAEMLEMLLFLMLPRRDVYPAAHNLIREFGSLKNVLFAPIPELKRIEGVGLKAALLLRFFGDVSGYLNKTTPEEKEILTSFDTITQFCVNQFKDKSSEILTLLLFNDKDSLQHVLNISSDKPNHIAADYREIIRQILMYDCRKVIIAHNHPAGTENPSDSDIICTRELCDIFEIIGVELVDHIIVNQDKAMSLRDSGNLEDRGKK